MLIPLHHFWYQSSEYSERVEDDLHQAVLGIVIFVSEFFVVVGASSLAADGWIGGLPGEGHRRWSRAREDGPLCVAKSLGERGKRDSQVRDKVLVFVSSMEEWTVEWEQHLESNKLNSINGSQYVKSHS